MWVSHFFALVCLLTTRSYGLQTPNQGLSNHFSVISISMEIKYGWFYVADRWPIGANFSVRNRSALYPFVFRFIHLFVGSMHTLLSPLFKKGFSLGPKNCLYYDVYIQKKTHNLSRGMHKHGQHGYYIGYNKPGGGGTGVSATYPVFNFTPAPIEILDHLSRCL